MTWILDAVGSFFSLLTRVCWPTLKEYYVELEFYVRFMLFSHYCKISYMGTYPHFSALNNGMAPHQSLKG
jgi:hypothetical protein